MSQASHPHSLMGSLFGVGAEVFVVEQPRSLRSNQVTSSLSHTSPMKERMTLVNRYPAGFRVSAGILSSPRDLLSFRDLTAARTSETVEGGGQVGSKGF